MWWLWSAGHRPLAALLCLSYSVTALNLVVVHYEVFNMLETSPQLQAALVNTINNIRSNQRNVIVLNPSGVNNSVQVGVDVNAVGLDSVQGLGVVPLLSHGDRGGATVAANLRLPPSLRDQVLSSVVLQLAGYKLGVVGFVPSHMALVLMGADFLDLVTAVRTEASRLRKRRVDIVVALGHASYTDVQRLAQEVAELDAVVTTSASRPNDPFPASVKQRNGDSIPVLQAPLVVEKAYVAMTTISTDRSGKPITWHGRVIPLKTPEFEGEVLGQDQNGLSSANNLTKLGGDVPEIPAASTFNRLPVIPDNRLPQDTTNFSPSYNTRLFCEAFENSVRSKIGETLVRLDGDPSSCSREECSLGSVFADALLNAAILPSETSWSEVSFAIINAGSIRGSLERCSITESDLGRVVSLGTTVVALSIPGKDLRKAFENSVSKHETLGKRFLQVSGVRVLYDLSKPAGSRVKSLKVLCSECISPEYEDVRDSQLYRLVTNSFLAGGGDDYSMFKDTAMFVSDSLRTELEVYREYVRNKSPLLAPVGGRIFFEKTVGEIVGVSPGVELPEATVTTGGDGSSETGSTTTVTGTTGEVDSGFSTGLWALAGLSVVAFLLFIISVPAPLSLQG